MESGMIDSGMIGSTIAMESGMIGMIGITIAMESGTIGSTIVMKGGGEDRGDRSRMETGDRSASTHRQEREQHGQWRQEREQHGQWRQEREQNGQWYQERNERYARQGESQNEQRRNGNPDAKNLITNILKQIQEGL